MTTDNSNHALESASVALAEGMHMVGEIDDFRIDLDAAEAHGGVGAGPEPLRMLLLGIAGCTAMDVLAILRKKRQQVSDLRVEVTGHRIAEHPRVYERIDIVYRIRGSTIDPQAVERAIELSETRYCPAIAMLSKAVDIRSSYELEEAA